MTQGTKTTSLEKLTWALSKNGWEFTCTKTQVFVPDPENAVYSRYSSRAAHIPRKRVPGVEVEANNKADDHFQALKFTARFTADGKWVEATGAYPIGTGSSLRKVIEQIERRSPAKVEANKQAEAERNAQHLAEYDAKVATAYAEAQATKAAKENDLIAELIHRVGLNGPQADKVIAMLTEGSRSPVANYLNAATQVERTAQGWIGESYCPATYVDGKRVEGSEG